MTSDKAKAYMDSKLRKSDFLKSPTKKLLIHTGMTDEKGNKAPQNIGTFHIVGTDLYSDNIDFRPLAAVNKLMKLVQSTTKEGKKIWTAANETIFFNHYGEIIYDKKGGLACGKVFGDAKANMTKEQLNANNEKAKSFLFIFGLAKFPNSDEWHFVDFRVGGKRIIEAGNAFSNKTIGKNHVMSQFTYELTTTPTDTVHPTIHFKPDLDVVLDVDDILDYDSDIANYIEEHNNRIIAQYKRYNAQKESIVDDNSEVPTLEIDEDE